MPYSEITVIKPRNGEKNIRLEEVLAHALSGHSCEILNTKEEVEAYFKEPRQAGHILFALSLGKFGINE